MDVARQRKQDTGGDDIGSLDAGDAGEIVGIMRRYDSLVLR